MDSFKTCHNEPLTSDYWPLANGLMVKEGQNESRAGLDLQDEYHIRGALAGPGFFSDISVLQHKQSESF